MQILSYQKKKKKAIYEKWRRKKRRKSTNNQAIKNNTQKRAMPEDGSLNFPSVGMALSIFRFRYST